MGNEDMISAGARTGTGLFMPNVAVGIFGGCVGGNFEMINGSLCREAERLKYFGMRRDPKLKPEDRVQFLGVAVSLPAVWFWAILFIGARWT